jgi:DNA-binding transcriptional LysR family regulator
VKYIPSMGHNDPDLYGEVTQEAVARVSGNKPGRPPVIVTTVSAARVSRGEPELVLRRRPAGGGRLLRKAVHREGVMRARRNSSALDSAPSGVGACTMKYWRCRRVARQAVSLVGRMRTRGFRFPNDLRAAPMILPGPDSEIRTEFDSLCEQLGIKVVVLAEVDDMATMRLLARDSDAIALVPSVVVRDELQSRILREHCIVPGLLESFYAITVDRRFQHPVIKSLLGRDEADILEMSPRTGHPRGRAG